MQHQRTRPPWTKTSPRLSEMTSWMLLAITHLHRLQMTSSRGETHRVICRHRRHQLLQHQLRRYQRDETSANHPRWHRSTPCHRVPCVRRLDGWTFSSNSYSGNAMMWWRRRFTLWRWMSSVLSGKTRHCVTVRPTWRQNCGATSAMQTTSPTPIWWVNCSVFAVAGPICWCHQWVAQQCIVWIRVTLACWTSAVGRRSSAVIRCRV